ncbi:MAG: glycosyltransferase [Gammaproteobacteria bacterium]|nr:glycosyltransferase [Gammaproteobacteria bacterium]
MTFVFIVYDTPGVACPPKGWGSVESLVCDYKTYLEELGHKASIIRDANLQKVIDKVNQCRPDVVHSHWKHSMQIMRRINAPVKILSAHSGWGPESALRGFNFHFNHLSQYLVDGWVWAALSPAWEKTLLDFGYHPAEIFVAPNGADHRRYRFRKTPLHAGRSLWLGRIQPRKRPMLFQAIDSLDFVGPHPEDDERFDKTRENYLGEWTREHLYGHLSDYANLVILSESEAAAPLVILEALVCGLGVVVSAGAAANLDTRLPWIRVIPEEKITDIAFVEAEIARNREIALRHREQIREYGIGNFSWEKLVPRYADLCRKLYDEKIARQGFLPRKVDTLRRLFHILPTLHRFTVREVLLMFRQLFRSAPPLEHSVLIRRIAYNEEHKTRVFYPRRAQLWHNFAVQDVS